MKKSTLIHCLLVSIIVSIIAAMFSTTILVAPGEGEEVLDLSHVATNTGNIELMVESIPMRQVKGLERFTYPLSHPEYTTFFLKAISTWFIGLFIATLIVSLLNEKST